MRRTSISSAFVLFLLAWLTAGGALAAPSAQATSAPDQRILLARSKTWAGPSHIWSIAPDGSGLRRLTPAGSNDYGPTWSPDHRYIAYIHRGGGATTVWRMHADGSHRRQIKYTGPSLTGAATALSWSPDGRSIVGGCRLSKKSPYPIAITALDVGTRKSRRVTTIKWAMTITSLDWSPDSSRLLACTMTADPGSAVIVDVASGAIETLGVGSYDSSWSPDGTHLLISAFMDGASGLWPPYQYQLQVRDAAGNYEMTLHPAKDWVGPCAYSPDGSLCAFVSGGNQRTRLLIQRTDGTQAPKAILSWTKGGADNVAWK